MKASMVSVKQCKAAEHPGLVPENPVCIRMLLCLSSYLTQSRFPHSRRHTEHGWSCETRCLKRPAFLPHACTHQGHS